MPIKDSKILTVLSIHEIRTNITHYLNNIDIIRFIYSTGIGWTDKDKTRVTNIIRYIFYPKVRQYNHIFKNNYLIILNDISQIINSIIKDPTKQTSNNIKLILLQKDRIDKCIVFSGLNAEYTLNKILHKSDNIHDVEILSNELSIIQPFDICIHINNIDTIVDKNFNKYMKYTLITNKKYFIPDLQLIYPIKRSIYNTFYQYYYIKIDFSRYVDNNTEIDNQFTIHFYSS